jgi:Sigma-70 factor, region 1.2
MAISKGRAERDDDEDLVHLYLTDVGQHALLSKTDEVRLTQQIEAASLASDALTQRGRTISPSGGAPRDRSDWSCHRSR